MEEGRKITHDNNNIFFFFPYLLLVMVHVCKCFYILHVIYGVCAYF